MGVNLEKGQAINLEKDGGGGALDKVFVGLGWDVASGGSIDLDASAVMLDDANRPVDTVWFRQLQSRDGSIKHSGDNLTGAGDGDDEVINVDLSRVPASVKTIVFTVNSFTGQGFGRVANAFARVVNASGGGLLGGLVGRSGGNELGRYNLSLQGKEATALILAKIYRHNNGWKFKAIGELANGRTVQDVANSLASVI